MPHPMLQRPVTQAALRRYTELWEDTALREDVRNTCLVALGAVGRMDWNNSSQNITNMHAGLHNWSDGVNCWSSILKFAMVSGAMTKVQHAKVVDALTGPTAWESPSGGQKNIVKLIYSDVPHTDWNGGAQVPIGAMVYHGRNPRDAWGNPIAHVTLHVGNNMVVGSWQAQFGPEGERSPEEHQLLAQINDLKKRGWSGDTLYTPMDAFEHMEWVSYSDGPFWDYL